MTEQPSRFGEIEKEVRSAEEESRLAKSAGRSAHREKVKAATAEAPTALAREAASLVKEFSGKAAARLGPEGSPERALVKLQKKELLAALQGRQDLQKALDEFTEERIKILKGMRDVPGPAETRVLDVSRDKIEDKGQEVGDFYQNSPEAFYGLHSQDLKNYKRQEQPSKKTEKGKIVETPYVREQVEKIISHAQAGKPVLIYGHLGTGKSELAMHVA